jgi:predicted RNA-binding Zn-ribbon protein involved in translation (DUF1610 family)
MANKMEEECVHEWKDIAGHTYCFKCGEEERNICLTCNKLVDIHKCSYYYFLGNRMHSNCITPIEEIKRLKEDLEFIKKCRSCGQHYGCDACQITKITRDVKHDTR